MALLRLAEIRKQYGGVAALRHADLVLERGSVHAVLGENGAGKSTLMKIITGVVRPDAGTISLNDTPVAFASPRDAQRAGISCVFQELSLIPDLSVAANICATAGSRRFGFFDPRQQRREAAALLAVLDADDIDVKRPARDLTPSQAQLVEIAKALARKPAVLILDEATSSLSELHVAALFRHLRELQQQGVGMLYISHRMHEIDKLADTCSIFRNGQSVETFKAGTYGPDEIIRMMIGRDIDQVYPPRRERSAGEPVLSVRELGWKDRLADITVDVRSGEILGIGGLDGQGQREFLLSLFGVLRKRTGKVAVMGQAGPRSPRAALRKDPTVAFTPEDRKRDGLHLQCSIRDNLSLTVPGRFSRLGVIRPLAREALVQSLVERLQIKAPSLDVSVGTLSGGNQQKVVLGKYLAADPKLVVLNDPTRGIDVGTKTEIYRLLRQLADAGAAVVLQTSDVDELVGLCDRVAVFYGGRLVRELHGAEITEEAVLSGAFNLEDSRRAA